MDGLLSHAAIEPTVALLNAVWIVFRKRRESYEEQLGNAALKKAGKKKWNHRVAKAIKILRILTHFDHLYIGGGNSKAVTLDLPSDVRLVSNDLGMRGGIWLWRERGPGSADIFRRIDGAK